MSRRSVGSGLGWLIAAMALAGCKGPFAEVVPDSRKDRAIVSYCGSAAATAASVIKTMDSLGREESALPAPNEVTVCIEVHNHESSPLRVDRSRARLKCPREQQSWVPDADDPELVVPPGLSRKFRVTFRYSPLVSGEDVSVLLDRALTRGDRPVAVAPIVLRRR